MPMAYDYAAFKSSVCFIAEHRIDPSDHCQLNPTYGV